MEVGAGDGEFTKRLASSRSKIIATDITPKVVERGRASFRNDKIGNVIFEVGDVDNISYKNKTFDIVCGVSILTHTDYKKSLKEIFRVLKDNGQIFFSEPNLLNPIIYSDLNINYLRKKMEFSPRETGLVRWDVQDTLEKIGLRKVKVVNYDFLHPKTPQIMLRPVEGIGKVLERVPLIKEISGSLIIWAKKQLK